MALALVSGLGCSNKPNTAQACSINSVKTATQYYLGEYAAIVAFCDVNSNTDPVSLITNDAIRAQLLVAVGNPITNSNTTITSTMLTTLDGFEKRDKRHYSHVVFVYGNGCALFEGTPEQVISACEGTENGVHVSAIGIKTDSKLQEIVQHTKGEYFGTPKNFMDIKFALTQATCSLTDRFLFLKGGVASTQTGNDKRASSLEPVHIPFTVDPSIERLWFSVGYSGGADGAALSLMKPDSSTMTAPVSIAPDGLATFDHSITNPPSGEWALVGTKQREAHIDYFAHIRARGGPYLSWITMEESPDGGEYLIVVSLGGEASIDEAKVTGQIQAESGAITTCVFSNFVTGIYGAEYRPDKSGYVRVTVTASNPDKVAFMTWRDVLFSARGDEDFSPPEDVPISNNFVRTISERVYVKAKGEK